VVHKDAVVVDPHPHALAGQAGVPHLDDVDGVVDPLAGGPQRVLGVGVGGDAGLGGVAQHVAQVVVWVPAGGFLVVAAVPVGILAGSVPGAVVAALGVQAAVAIGPELLAHYVAIDAILTDASISTGSTVLRIVADSVPDCLALVVGSVILFRKARIICTGRCRSHYCCCC